MRTAEEPEGTTHILYWDGPRAGLPGVWVLHDVLGSPEEGRLVLAPKDAAAARLTELVTEDAGIQNAHLTPARDDGRLRAALRRIGGAYGGRSYWVRAARYGTWTGDRNG